MQIFVSVQGLWFHNQFHKADLVKNVNSFSLHIKRSEFSPLWELGGDTVPPLRGGGRSSNSRTIACTTRPRSECTVNWKIIDKCYIQITQKKHFCRRHFEYIWYILILIAFSYYPPPVYCEVIIERWTGHGSFFPRKMSNICC